MIILIFIKYHCFILINNIEHFLCLKWKNLKKFRTFMALEYEVAWCDEGLTTIFFAYLILIFYLSVK